MARHAHQSSSTRCFSRLPPATLALLALVILLLYLTSTPLLPRSVSQPASSFPHRRRPLSCADPTDGRWIRLPPPGRRHPLYDSSCPFHRNAWNCIRNGRENMDSINSWAWVPSGCGGEEVPTIEPAKFLEVMRGKRIGFVGDSLNENFLVAFLCALRSADRTAKKWKKMGAWRGGYFPKFDVTVAYHRSVLLAKYQWQPAEDLAFAENSAQKGFYRVDVDCPADEWINVTKLYDVLIFNTGHWWGLDKFPMETPLIFYRDGKPIVPPLSIFDGLEVVLNSMISYIERTVPKKTLKFWRTQSPRHFHGGEWNKNGSCLFTEPLGKEELDSWFNPSNNGVNKEARVVNSLVLRALQGTQIKLLNLTHLSEFRADAHPAIWLGKKDAVAIWGQDCLHWCLPGLPDTWVDILSAHILSYLELR